ncbi:MAG: pentapeptide repeat-containing protein [Oligoflexales bacterium]
MKLGEYTFVLGIALILSLGFVSCGQIKQKQSKQDDSRFRLLARSEEPKNLEIDEGSIFAILNLELEQENDPHCKFIEKAVEVFKETHLVGVDYYTEKCRVLDDHKRELRFKVKRKGSFLWFSLKTKFRECDELERDEAESDLKLYTYEASFKQIDSNAEEIEFNPTDRNKVPDILHTKLSHIGKTLSELLTFNQKNKLDECLEKGRLLNLNSQKCFFGYSSDKKFEDLNVKEFNPEASESERKIQFEIFLRRFHEIMLIPIVKGKGPVAKIPHKNDKDLVGLDDFHSSYLGSLSFNPAALVEKIEKEDDKSYEFFNYTFTLNEDESRKLEIGVYNILGNQKPGRLQLFFKINGVYQNWDIDGMKSLDILHPNMIHLVKFFDIFSKKPFQTQEDATDSEKNPEQNMNIVFAESGADYDEFFRKTQLRYENLFLEHLNLPNVAFKLNNIAPLPRKAGQSSDEVGKAYMQQNQVSFKKFKFNELDLADFDFSHSIFEQGLMIDCCLTGSNFIGAKFVKVDFSGSRFSLSIPAGEDLNHVVQPFHLTQFDQINLKQARFSGLKVGEDKVLLDFKQLGRQIQDEFVKDWKIEVLSLQDSEFKWVDFGELLILPFSTDHVQNTGPNMMGIKLVECSIMNKRFFENADLRGAEIIDTQITDETSFAGAIFDSRTKFTNSLNAFDKQQQEQNFRLAFKDAHNVKIINLDDSGCDLCKLWLKDL